MPRRRYDDDEPLARQRFPAQIFRRHAYWAISECRDFVISSRQLAEAMTRQLPTTQARVTNASRDRILSRKLHAVYRH